MEILVLLLGMTLLFGVVKGDIRNLEIKEFLQSDDVSGFMNPQSLDRSKRAVPDEGNIFKHLQFTAFGRHFDIQLVEDRGALARGFQVTLIGADGTKKPYRSSQNNLYKGVVKGEPESEVFLHRDTDDANVFYAKIITSMETYYIEPTARLNLTEASTASMLVYRASDLQYTAERPAPWDSTSGAYIYDMEYASFYVSSKNATSTANHSDTPDRSVRAKRSISDDSNTCYLTLVADYKFFMDIMGGSVPRTRYYLIDLVSRVDAIYRKTKFRTQDGTQITNFGFSIQKLLIYNEPNNATADGTGLEHFNVYSDTRKTSTAAGSELLTSFSLEKNGNDFSKTCLAHLFTAYAFPRGLLGRAYIAPPKVPIEGYGGICSYDIYSEVEDSVLYVNTGWSSAVNTDRQNILTQEAEIVLAHELGHNWGAEHDPPGSCSPGGSDGNYIMHRFAVKGFDANNQRFSTCSESSIGQAIHARASSCFKEYIGVNSNGNYRRDEGEDCDDGPDGSVCCTSDQKYTPGTDCSITNDKCCLQEDTKCTLAAASNMPCVNASSEDSTSCLDYSYCDGVSPSCLYRYKPHGSRCAGGYGRCIDSSSSVEGRVCRGFLRSIGLISCICSDEPNRCKECIWNAETEKCVPFDYNNYNKSLVALPDSIQTIFRSYTLDDLTGLNPSTGFIASLPNSECYGGTCVVQNGGVTTCKPLNTELVARFWKFLSELDLNRAVEFMRDNIVGTIITFSLLVWVPCVAVVHYHDVKKEKKERLKGLVELFPRPDTRFHDNILATLVEEE